MYSKNLRNKELEFTPTFGTQLSIWKVHYMDNTPITMSNRIFRYA